MDPGSVSAYSKESANWFLEFWLGPWSLVCEPRVLRQNCCKNSNNLKGLIFASELVPQPAAVDEVPFERVFFLFFCAFISSLPGRLLGLLMVHVSLGVDWNRVDGENPHVGVLQK